MKLNFRLKLPKRARRDFYAPVAVNRAAGWIDLPQVLPSKQWEC